MSLSMRGQKSPLLRLAPLLLVLVAASTALHALLGLYDAFGEPDAARLADYATVAAAMGRYQGVQYTAYTSPLYLESLRVLLQSKLLGPNDLPWFMTAISVLAAAGTTACLFVFANKVTGSLWAAFGVALLIQFAPVFWFNSVYGFASMVSLMFFFAGLLSWAQAVKSERKTTRWAFGLLAMLALWLAAALKLDTLLAGALYCLPIWLSNKTLLSKLIWSAALLVAGGFIFLSVNAWGQYLARFEPAGFTWGGWDARFPVSLAAFISRGNIRITAGAAGALAIPAGLFAAAFVVRDPKQRTVVFWLAMAAVPLVLFWGVRYGNSARHNLVPVVVLYLLLALPLAGRQWRAWAIVLAALCLVDYLVFPPSPDTTAPSGRLNESTERLQASARTLRARGAAIAERPEAKLAIVGRGQEHPFFEFESLRRADFSSIAYVPDKHGDSVSMTTDGRERRLLFLYFSADLQTLRALADQGWMLLIDDPALVPVLEQTPALKGKWLPAP